MFDTFDLRGAAAFEPFRDLPRYMAVPAFLGSGTFRLAEPDPRGPDETERERWEGDGGPCNDGEDC